MRQIELFATMLLACVATICAAADRAGIESVRFRHFTVTDGLSQATIRAMAQDESGFLWFGTQDGLNRFDGYEFRVFQRDPDDPGALADSHVLGLAAQGDAVWVATQNGGLARFDPVAESFRTYPAGDRRRGQIAANPVSAVLAHRSGRIWVGSGNGHLQRLRENGLAFDDISGERYVHIGAIRSLRESLDGSVLIGASSGVWRVSANSESLQSLAIDGAPLLDVNDAIGTPDASIWIATEGEGLWQVDRAGHVRRRLGSASGLADEAVRGLGLDGAGRLWVATAAGLSRVDRGGESVQSWGPETLLQDDGLSATRLQSVFEDRDGLLWVGSWANGINVFDPRTEAFVTARPQPGRPHSLPGYAATDLATTAEGDLWVALNDVPHLVRFNPEQGVMQSVDRVLNLGRESGLLLTRSVALAEDGTLWVAMGRHGVGRIAVGAREIEQFAHRPDHPESPPAGEIFGATITEDGSLWVASTSDGIAVRCGTCDGFAHYRHDPADPYSLPGNETTDVVELRQGELWVITRHHGASRLDRATGRFTTLHLDANDPLGISHPTATAAFADSLGRLWVGTQGGGLNRIEFDDLGAVSKVTRVGRRAGLAAEAVGAILADRQGKLWVSTTVGISRVDPDTLEINNFGARDGALKGGYFIGSGAGLPDGRLAFGGLRGVTLVDPGQAKLPPDPAEVAATEIRIFGIAGNADGGGDFRRRSKNGLALDLPAGVDSFQVDLSALMYASPEQLRFSYRLDPLSSDWITTDARRRFASFTNVPPGQYAFRARAQRPGRPVSAELTIPVAIARPFGAAEQIRLALLLAAVILTAVVIWLLQQRLRERQAAQGRLAASEERLKLTLWGTGDELWDMDLKRGVFQREHALPYSPPADADGTVPLERVWEICHPEDLPRLRDAITRHLKGQSEDLDATFRVRSGDGGWRWLRSRGRVVWRDAAGLAQRMTGTTSDVTELKQNEEALERSNQALEQRVRERTQALSNANVELEETLTELTRTQGQLVEQEKLAALGGLVAGVAHEINTPLGIGVTAASHLAASTHDFRRKVDAGKVSRSTLDQFLVVAEESAELVLRNIARADKLVKSFKQVAVDQSSEERREINLGAYLEEVVTSLRPVLKKGQHRIVLDLAAPITLYTLPGAIYQTVANLVQNSVLHGFADRKGGEIRIRASSADGACLIEYRDDGVGMAEEVRRRMFEPFFTTRRGHGGSGLGMHITYNLATRALNGQISCESSPGQGVRIQIRVPMRLS